MTTESEIVQRLQNLAELHTKFTQAINDLDTLTTRVGGHTIKACEYLQTGDLDNAISEIEKAEKLLP